MSATPARREEKAPQVSPLTAFRELLERQTSQFEMVMPKEVVDRFKRVLVTTLSDKPELLRCNPRSIISVAMHAAADNLLLDGREAAIVPFKSGQDTIATYIPMVAGLRKKVRASDLIADWNVQVVFEGDQFDVAFGDSPYLKHKPALHGGSKRPIRGAYSVATFKDGTQSFEWMTREQIEEIKGKSAAVRAKRATPWDDPVFYPEMCRKTVARRHAKQLPMGSDIENVFRHEEQSQIEAEGEAERAYPAIEQQRAASVSQTLDDFGAGSSLPDDTSSQAEPTTPVSAGQVTARDVDQAAGAETQGASAESSPSVSPASESRPSTDDGAVAAARKRGREDANKGAARKAIPGELRDDERLWKAWLAGYDEAGR